METNRLNGGLKRKAHRARPVSAVVSPSAEQAASAMLKALEDIYQKARPRSLVINGPVVDYYVEAALINALRPIREAAKQAGIKP